MIRRLTISPPAFCILLLAFSFLLLASCCPEIITTGSQTKKTLTAVRKDTIYVESIKPAITITDESATFIEKPSVEIIDTVIRAKETLRDYSVKITRTRKPVLKIVNDAVIKEELESTYDIEFTPVKPDSIFNEITTKSQSVIMPRPWYEIPVFAGTVLAAFITGIYLGKILRRII